MPNCDWYATLEDHQVILDLLFAHALCDVYELYSAPQRPLQQFHSANEVLAQFERRYPNGRTWRNVYLQLYVKDSGPPPAPRRVELNPSICDGATFRFKAEGWGLVQLDLATLGEDAVLDNSHTNHNSQLRAERWSLACPESLDPTRWDFQRITAFSSRLNREIR